jgi:acetoin utilization deacetylase AcuC-like enzyme
MIDVVDSESMDGRNVHTHAHVSRVANASALLKPGETSYTLNEDNYENMHTFAAAKVAADAVLTAANAMLDPATGV